MNSYYLSELLEIKNGRDHKNLSEGNIPVFGSGGLMRFVDKAIYNDESILLPRKGSLGNIQFTKDPFWTVDTLYYTIVDKKKANAYYLYNYLKRLDLSNLNSGTGVPSMTFGAYYDIQINLPDLSTQKKIASVLSALDDKIELNNSINSELEQMAKTLYDYWFVQFDFPNEEGKPYKSSGGKMVYNEVLKREIPEGWEVKKLEKCVQKIIDYRGKTPKKLGKDWSVSPNDITALSAKHVKNGKLVNLQSANRVDKELYKTWMKDKLEYGDILMTSEAPCGEFFYLIGKTEFCLSQRLFAIRSNPNIVHHSYLYFELSAGNGYSQILGKVSGSTVFGIRQDELRTVDVLIPKIEKQKYFGQKIERIIQKIRNNDYQNQELAQLRDWLLPMLMNGQVKVNSEYTAKEEDLSVAAEPIVAYVNDMQLNIPANKKGFAKQVLAGKIVSEFKDDPNFTDIKFQKIQFLAEHIIEADLNLNYYYQAAGPYDNKFMHTIYTDFSKQKWFDCQDKKFVPLEKHEKIEGYYQGYFAPVQERLNKLFELLYQTSEAEAEIIATLYAVWNNRIIESRPVTENELIDDFYQWSDRKLQYKEEQLFAGLHWLKENQMEPNGFGQLIKKAKGKSNLN